MGAAENLFAPVKTLSVREAARRASRRSVLPAVTHSHWLAEVIPLKGRKRKGVWKHNLTTDTASGYTNRRDWQSKAMGMGPSFTFATAEGAATASSATTLTNTGASFTTAGQGLAGQIVVAVTAGGTLVYGVIVSNTATVLTVDQWYNPTSATGAAGTTPSATGRYMVLPGQNPAAWIALTTDATAPAATDTTLATELTTLGFSRAVGTYAHTAAATTYTLTKLFTATGTATINKSAIFGAATSANGVMPFESAVTSPPTLISGDTLTMTATITIN